MPKPILLLLMLTVSRQIEAFQRSDERNITLNILFMRRPTWPKENTDFLIRQAEIWLKETNRLNESLKFSVTDRANCGPEPAKEYEPVKDLVELYGVSHFDAIIGPYCSPGMIHSAHLAVKLNIPIIGYLSISSKLADKSVFQTLARVSIGTETLGLATIAFINHFKWKHVGLIWDPDEFGAIFIYTAVKKQLDLHKIQHTIVAATKGNQSIEIPQALQTLKDNARIIIVAMGYYVRRNNWVMEEFIKANMTNPEYLFIVPTCEDAGEQLQNMDSIANFNKAFVARHCENSWQIFTLLTQIGSEALDHEEAKRFQNKIIQMGYPGKFGDWTDLYYLLILDAFSLYMMVANEIYNKNLNDLRNGTAFMKKFRNRKFDGASGHVHMGPTADRLPNYRIYSIIGGNYSTAFKTETIMKCHKDCDIDGNQKVGDIEHKMVLNQFWDGYLKFITIPKDKPECGFRGELCDQTSFYVLLIGSVLCVAFAALGLVSYKRIQNITLYGMPWRVRMTAIGDNDSFHDSHSTMGKSAMVSEKMGVNSAKIGKKNVTKDGFKQQRTIAFTREQLTTLKLLKEITHENLSEFVGLCFNEPMNSDQQNLIILWSQAKRGTLEDLVFSTEMQLEAVFSFSFIRDIINGLEYIHKSSLGAHGALRIDNCEVDAQWTVKLKGFGLQPMMIHMTSQNDIEFTQPNAIRLLRTAPELLKQNAPNKHPTAATKEGDIYGLGVIIYQIIFRFDPFEEYGMVSNEDILEQVIAGTSVTPKIPNRSKIINLDLLMAMKGCWNDELIKRPQLRDLKRIVAAVNPGKGTIVDQMMHMMERYAGNLEKLVRERTAALEEAQQKADMLLCRMLPKSVATQLKAGFSVKPKTYTSATVFFCDIVQFTKLCSESTPLEIVNFLNALYSQFDAVIDRHDAYKVETVGDSYLVVSGVPSVNGKAHAWHIADIALCMIELVSSFIVQHRPERVLQIRCGAHSGSVAAGVIGITTPRYCIFGDTVNTASRMESTGEPDKVQVTQTTKDLLEEQSADFKMDERGVVSVKGKGHLTTYWLTRAQSTLMPGIPQ